MGETTGKGMRRRTLRGRPAARAALGVILAFAALAAWGEATHAWHAARGGTAPWAKVDLMSAYRAPAWGGPWLGTDGLGRDVAQRLIQGTRIAFRVGLLTAALAVPLGLLLGCLAGYFGGRTDDAVVALYSAVAAIPGVLLILAIALLAGKGLWGICLGVGLTTWVGLCRLARAETLRQRALPYVEAARVAGLSCGRILFRHILPNVTHLAVITFTLRFPAAIGTEVLLSYLGVGVQDEPSWGLMIQSARLRLWDGVWWELASVTAAIFLLTLAFNILGDALRDALDPRRATAAPA